MNDVQVNSTCDLDAENIRLNGNKILRGYVDWIHFCPLTFVWVSVIGIF